MQHTILFFKAAMILIIVSYINTTSDILRGFDLWKFIYKCPF